MNTESNKIKGYCKRCGTCCSRGGPALHREDIALVRDGTISPECLETFLAGEAAFDPSRGTLIRLQCDMIKIKGKPGTWECIFYGGVKAGCTIYSGRPLECRMLKCWDTAGIEALFLKKLATRTEICENEEIKKLMNRHDASCGTDAIEKIVANHAAGQDSKLQELIEEDRRFRENAVRHYGINASECDFLFGRPASIIADGLIAARKYGL